MELSCQAPLRLHLPCCPGVTVSWALAVCTGRPSPEAPPTGPSVISSLWRLLWLVSWYGAEVAPYLSCLGGTLHKSGRAASAPLPHTRKQPSPTGRGELGRDLSVAACQVGSGLRPAEGLPPTAAISGDSLGVTLNAPAPCLCHMNVFSGPNACLPPSEKGHSPSPGAGEHHLLLSWPRPCL